MKDENGNEIQHAVVEIYRLRNTGEERHWSRKHNIWLYRRTYTLEGDVTWLEAERVLTAMFQRTPRRTLINIEWDAGYRRCAVHWQQDETE